MKFFAGFLTGIVFVLVAGFGYATHQTKVLNSSDAWMERLEKGKAGPVAVYQILVGDDRRAEADSIATVHIARENPQMMWHAKQLPGESRSDYVERVNRGREIMGFTPLPEDEIL